MAPSMNVSRLAQILDISRIQQVFQCHRTATIAALCAAVIVPLAVQDYLTFLSYGPGGLPYNVGGWLVTHALRVVSREQLSVAPYYDGSIHQASEPGFLSTDFPPQRRSERPRLGPHPVPQRQLSQLPAGEMRERLIVLFGALGKAAEAKGLVEVQKSQLERQHDALFVSNARDWHPVAQQMRERSRMCTRDWTEASTLFCTQPTV